MGRPAVNLAAAYSALTVPQLKEMLGAARINHRRELEGTRAKWAAEVAALREAASKHLATLTAELQPRRTTTPHSSASSTSSTSSWRKPTP